MKKIFDTVFSGTVEQLSKLIESGENINVQDKEKRTPLIHATIDNKIDMIRTLVQNNADVNLQDSLGYSALHYAAQNYLIDAAQLLLKNKAIVDVQDIHGNTPLFRAVFHSRGRGEMVNLLLSSGADMNLKNNHGVSPIELANSIGNYNVSQFMK